MFRTLFHLSFGPTCTLLSFLALSSVLMGSPAYAGEIVVDLGQQASLVENVGADGAVRLTFDGASELRDFGKPLLPTQRLLVLVPRGQQVTSVSVEGAQPKSLGIISGLARYEGDFVPEDGLVAKEQAFDAALHKSAALYPPVEARVTADQYYHGYHLVAVEVYPVRQVVESGELIVHSGGSVRLSLGAADRDIAVADRQRHDPAWRARVAGRVAARIANPQALTEYRLPATAPVEITASPGKTPSLASSPVQLLIVTNAAMAPQFQRLADHRKSLGMPSLVVTKEDILANYRHGLDFAETLRLYVIDAYAKWGVDYLLLGGDTEVLDPRYANSTFYPPGGSTDIPSDLYFGCLDGNWNDDGDAIFGEPFVSGLNVGDFVDFTAEVSVGRATVDDLAAAEVFVDKVLAYEMPQSVTHQASALLASEVLFPQDWQPGDGIQLDGATFSEVIHSNMMTCDPTASWSTYRSYQNYTAYPGSVPETKADVLAQMDSGNYGVVNHIGHGFYFNMSVGDDNIVVADVDQLTNAPNYFVLYALNCSSGAFDFNCLLERFLTNPDGGSVASIGSARSAFPNAANNYQQAFYEAWLCSTLPRLGDVMDDSRLDFTANTFWNTSDRWTHLVYNLLGDPSMRLWSSAPRPVSISAPASATLGSNNLLINVMDTSTKAPTPYEGVTVALTKAGESISAGVTDMAGNVMLPFEAEQLGDIVVWVSGANAIPQSTTIPVITGGTAFLAAQSLAFYDDGTWGSVGNGNGRVEGAERIAIVPLMRNSGSVAFGGGSVLLSTGDAFLTVVDGTAALGALPAASTLLASDAFLLDVDEGIFDSHEASLTLVADETGGSQWTDVEVVSFASPEIEVLKLTFDDDTFGNGNGLLDANEQVDVWIELKNFGGGAVGSVSGVLTSASPDVQILDGSSNWGAMPDPLASADNGADMFRVRETSIAQVNIYDLTLTDDLGRVRMVAFDLRRPNQIVGVQPGFGGPGETVVQWDPSSDADLLGYRVYRRPKGSTDPFDVASADIVVGSSLFRDSGLAPLTPFEYFVAGVDSGGLEGPASASIITATSPAEIGCFPLPLGLEASSSLAVGHVDTDEVPDMVIGADYVYVIDGDCQEKVDGDNDSQTFGPITNAAYKFTPPSIALGNLDSQPGQEIVTSAWGTSTAADRRTFVFDGMGNVLPGWPKQTIAKNWSTPALGDLDGDGDLEIVINDVTGYTSVFHHDGTELADGDANPSTIGPIAPRRVDNGILENFGRTSPALYDVDNDGLKEILFGSKFFNDAAAEYFYALKPDGSGTNAPGWPKTFAPKASFLASPTVADVDDDGIDEIIVICENDSLYVWKPDGSRLPGFPRWMKSDSVNKDSLTPSVAVGDFTHDGKLEMVAMGTISSTEDTACRIFDWQGNLLPGWPITVENLSEASPVVGDINGDGELDIVFGVGGAGGDELNLLHAFNKDGTDVDGFPILLNGFARATPTICDFNGDGEVNILLASWDKLIHVWDLDAPYVPALVPWPTFRGNVHRDGVFTTVPATAVDPGTLPALERTVMLPNVPNPFNPNTRIRFEVAGSTGARARLSIFDALGRHVATLQDGVMSPGAHEIVWQGLDASGRAVASGVYYARLEVEGQPSLTRKMALVK